MTEPDTLAPMGKGKGSGPGRPRTLSGEDDEKRASNTVVRLTDSHRAELDALISDGSAANRSEAIRLLIEASAKRRKAREARSRGARMAT